MSTVKAPSTMLLRALFKPSPCTSCQVRTLTGFMPRHKYAKVNRLDKLHRKQKEAIREERHATHLRASSMPTISQSPSESTTITTTASIPFTISRTTKRNLPIYETSKAGGSKHITQIRKLSGDLDLLASNLRTALNLPESYTDQKGRKKECVVVNRLTSQVVVRGWRGAEVKKWVEGLGF